MRNKILERRKIINRSNKELSKKSALFLDRDGVIVEDCHHLSKPKDVKLCLGACWLAREANKLGWPIIIVTNQSGISRGYFNWSDYEAVNEKMLELIGEESFVTAIYANGYGPEANPNSWRKPSPMMLFAAAKELNIDLERSILIGDRITDLQAGARAKVKTVMHVMTGHGKKERYNIENYYKEYNKFIGEKNEPDLVLLNTLQDFPLETLQK